MTEQERFAHYWAKKKNMPVGMVLQLIKCNSLMGNVNDAWETWRAANAKSVELMAEIKSAIEDYYKALNNRQHGGLAAHQALSRIEAILGMSWDEYNKENVLGNYAILAKEASNVSNS